MSRPELEKPFEKDRKPLGRVVFQDGTFQLFYSREELAKINQEADKDNPVVNVIEIESDKS